MTNSFNSSHMKEFSINKPQFFVRIDYYLIITRMTWSLKSIDYNFQNVIQNSDHILTKIENGVIIPKPS